MSRSITNEDDNEQRYSASITDEYNSMASSTCVAVGVRRPLRGCGVLGGKIGCPDHCLENIRQPQRFKALHIERDQQTVLILADQYDQ